MQGFIQLCCEKLALQINGFTKKLSRRDKMFIENVSNNQIYDPGRGRTPYFESVSINIRPLRGLPNKI